MTGDARLFVGLWPPAEVRAATWRHADRWNWPDGARRVRPDKLHLTLHFLGSVARERVALLAEILTVPFEPFELRLNKDELWPSGVAVLRSRASPRGLLVLHQRLSRALESAGQPLARSRLKPHVTLARQAFGAAPPADAQDIGWTVHGYALIESELQPPNGYCVVHAWP